MNLYQQIEFYSLSTAVTEPCYLLSYNGCYYEVGQPMIELLQALQRHSSENEAIVAFLKQKDGKYTAEQIKGVIDKYFAPLFEQKDAKPRSRIFLYEKELFTASTIDRFSDAFRFLFHPLVLGGVLLFALIADGYFMLTTENLFRFNNYMNVYTVLGIVAFMGCSSFFHELGHASACKHFGVKHGGIGFGLYLNFPVLYTEVSEVWKLGRKQRCVVNLAGVYFQCYVLLGLLIAFFITGNDVVRYLLLTLNLGFLMTLNPFFKFDGYWLASDLLGVPNLRSRTKEWLVYVYKRIRKQTVNSIPYLLRTRKLERCCLLVYSVLVNLFMGYYFFYIIPNFLYGFVRSFPKEMEELIVCLSNNITPPFALLRNFFMQLLFLALIVYMMSNLLRPLIRKYGKRSA